MAKALRVAVMAKALRARSPPINAGPDEHVRAETCDLITACTGRLMSRDHPLMTCDYLADDYESHQGNQAFVGGRLSVVSCRAGA
jgi:hypothetical protein